MKRLFMIDNNVSVQQLNLPYDNKSLRTEKLDQIEKDLAEKKIPLHPYPVVPQVTYPIIEENREKFIQFCEENLQETQAEILKKMAFNVQHISFPIFQKELKHVIEILNKELKGMNNPKYSLGFVIKKSNQWVSSLALPYLNYLPSDWFTPNINFAVGQHAKADFRKKIDTIKEKIVVVIDDCSYSGEQLKNSLEKITNQGFKVFAVVPFMSNCAIDKLKSINVQIITSDIRIPTVHELFSEGEVNQLKEVNIVKEGFKVFSLKGAFNKGVTLTYTDWRIPDPQSFVSDFGDTLKIPYAVPDPEDEKFSLIKFNRIPGFIPRVPKPY